MESTCTIYADGSQVWQLPNGKQHRVDGPAIIYPNNDQEWWVDGHRHRVNGPAVIRYGQINWWIRGIYFTDQVTAWMAENNLSWPFDADTQMEFIMRFA